MRFVFPAFVAVFIALLFHDIYSLSRPLREFDLPKPSRPNALQVLTPTPAPAPDVTPEPKLDAVAATPAPAPDVAPEPKLDAVAATPAPASDVAPEPKLGAAPKAQSAPEVLGRSSPRRVGRGLRRRPRKSASPQPDQPVLLARSPVGSGPGHQSEISASLPGNWHPNDAP